MSNEEPNSNSDDETEDGSSSSDNTIDFGIVDNESIDEDSEVDFDEEEDQEEDVLDPDFESDEVDSETVSIDDDPISSDSNIDFDEGEGSEESLEDEEDDVDSEASDWASPDFDEGEGSEESLEDEEDDVDSEASDWASSDQAESHDDTDTDDEETYDVDGSGFDTVNDSGGTEFDTDLSDPDLDETDDGVDFAETSSESSYEESGSDSDMEDDEEEEEYEDIEFIDQDDEEEEDPEEELEYESFEWSEQIEDFVGRIQEAREGDEEAIEDLKTAPGRVFRYFRGNSKAKDNLLDIFFPLTLVVYGFILLVAVLLSSSGSWANIILTGPSIFGDIFAFDLLFMLVAIGLLVFARDRSEFGSSSDIDTLRRRSRIGIVVLHMLPSLVVIGLVYLIFFGGGLETAQALQDSFYSILSPSSLPGPVAIVLGLVASIFPTGITVEIVGALMFVVGLVGTIPFGIGILKVVLIAVNIGAEEEEKSVEKAATEALLGGQIGAAPRQEASIDPDQNEYGEQPELGAIGSVESLFTADDDYRLEPYENYVEKDRYWLRKPYCYAVILENVKQGDVRYFVVEPSLNDTDRKLYDIIVNRLDTKVLYEDIDEEKADDILREEKADILHEKVKEITTETGIDSELSNTSFSKIMYYIERNFVDYGKIDPFMNDPNIEDISCNGPNKPLVVYHQSEDDLYTNIQFEQPEVLQRFIIQLAQRSGEQITKANPLQDASLPDGSRAQLTLGDEVTTDGSTFTIRQFQEVPFSPVDLLRYNTFNLKQMAYLWLAIENNKSLIFAGGTASGKTTSMNAVSLFIPPKKKIVSLEDTREITLPHENWIPGVTKEGSGAGEGDDVNMFNLLEAALRQRPEYLVVGEVRGDEAVTLFQAMSTGHTTYSTMHADSVQTAFNRLKNPPIEVPAKMLQALDIMCIQLRTHIKDENDEWKTVRRNAQTAEIEEVYQDRETAAEINPAFTWDAERDHFISRLDESNVLREIETEQGWSYQEVRNNIKKREKVLQYLLDNDVRDIEKVTRVIQAFMIYEEKVMKGVENDNLDIESLRDIEELNLNNLRELTEIQNDKLLEDLEG